MNRSFNTIVVGLGAMGSATLYQLAKRGIKALGIDHLSPPHTLGSTHGDTRITRQATGEGEHYTPLSLRAYEIFREVESKINSTLLEITGELITSSAAASTTNRQPDFFENTLVAARKYSIPHEVWDAQEIRNHFPQFNVDNDERGYYEPGAGLLRPEAAVSAQLTLARELGATIHTNESVKHFEESDKGITVHTSHDTYQIERLVLSVGPWLPQVVPELTGIFKIYRQVLYWFDISEHYDDFVKGKFPIFDWQIKGSTNRVYGFPAIDGPSGGLKIAPEDDYTDEVTPESVERTVSTEETESMFKNKVAPFIPKVSSKCVKSAVCLYTVTADNNFVIDWLPSSKRIILCSPCSGHGFKHSAAIGECVAQLTTTGETSIDIAAFRLARLLNKSPA